MTLTVVAHRWLHGGSLVQAPWLGGCEGNLEAETQVHVSVSNMDIKGGELRWLTGVEAGLPRGVLEGGGSVSVSPAGQGT